MKKNEAGSMAQKTAGSSAVLHAHKRGGEGGQIMARQWASVARTTLCFRGRRGSGRLWHPAAT